jgi:ABC-type transport system involved in multi-copper enzyme maturation permease subunit
MRDTRFQFQPNPIIVRELRTRMRGMRPYVILTLSLIVLILAGLGIYQFMLQQTRFGMTVLSAQVGQAMFVGLALCQLLLVVFLAPAMTSGSISGEREQLTYDMLMATPLRPGRLLWGKLIAALSYLFMLIIAALPIFSVVLIFGGVEPKALLKVVVLLVATTIFAGTLGLFFSSFFRRTASATVLSYTILLLIIGGTALLGAVWGQFSSPPGQQAPPWLLYLNPFTALNSITALAPRNDGGIFLGDGNPFAWLPFIGALGSGAIYYGPNGAVVVPIFRATLVCYAALTLLLCWIASHMVLPRRHWLPRWSDLSFLITALALAAVLWFSRPWWLVFPPV